MEWNEKHEEELLLLQQYSNELYKKYHKLFIDYTKKRDKYKIPVIILSSIVGVINLSNASYIPKQYYVYISIGTGLLSIMCSILASIEQLKKIGETMNKSLNSYLNFKMLSDEISHILRIPINERDKTGLEMVKYYFQKYQSYYYESPVLNELAEDFLVLKNDNKNNEIKLERINSNSFKEEKPIIFNL